MNIAVRCLILFFILGSLAGCGATGPTTEDARTAINDYFSTRGGSQIQVAIIRVGDRGKADFTAPGSQDTYWPVEFRRSGKEDVAKLGPLEISKSSNDHGVALIYKTKMGQWKVGRVDE
jgi:hypothetical protein